MNEERVVVASIVHQFRLSLVEGHEVEMVPKVVLRTKNDIQMNLANTLIVTSLLLCLSVHIQVYFT